MHEWIAPACPMTITAIALAFGLSGCEQRREEVRPGMTEIVAHPAPPAPALQRPILSRSDLLVAMEDAASEYSEGRQSRTNEIAGLPFIVRQAFGCFGPAAKPDQPANGLARWTRENDKAPIELSLTPEDWTKSPFLADTEARWEAVEGIWLVRPWLRSGDCPVVKSAPPRSPDLAGRASDMALIETMGLAVVFETQGSRLDRRNGRAYAYALRGSPEPPSSPENGFRLVIEGRLTTFPDGQVIRCYTADANQRPTCVAATQVDRVAFEDTDGSLLSEWRTG